MSSQPATRTAQAPDQARTHLARLGTMLGRRGHRIQLTTTAAVGTVLIVTHPGPPPAAITVVCIQSEDKTWHYVWGPEEGRCFGAASRAHFAAVRIDQQLHGKLEVPR